MIAAVHFENLLFLLFIFVAFLFRVLTGAANKASKGTKPPAPRSTAVPPPVTQARAETDEDRIRKFLEALGQPPGSTPPPPVTSRPSYQKPTVMPHIGPGPSPLPSLQTRPPELPRETKKVFQPRVAEPTTFEVRETPPSVESAPLMKAMQPMPVQVTAEPEEKRGGLMELLRSPPGLRDAIILREIFGPPRSMHPLELL